MLRHGSQLPGDLSEIDGQPEVGASNQSHIAFPTDMVEYHNWQGGGGYGDPLERDPDRVRRDVIDQLVSVEAAATLYGVVLANGELDHQATIARREELRRSRLKRSRPAAEVLGRERSDPACDWIDAAKGNGRLRYGNALEFNFEADQAACLSCGQVLGSARADFRRGCALLESPVTAAGPVRGEDYDRGRIRLRLYFCPGCGRQLDVEVALVGGPTTGFRLAPIPTE
jgi:N-methylhydantoinase B